ncbi:MAG: anti-sigma factor [Acidimicrobiia bacterium]|nr:anti-sigma factor [Acidimicrobiia bacterium]
MRCEEFRAAWLAGERSTAVVDHGKGCAVCRDSVPALDRSAALLSDPAMWEEPSDGAWERISGLIEGSPPPPRAGQVVKFAVAAMVGLIVSAAGFLAISAERAPDWELDLVAIDSAGSASVAGWNTTTGSRMVLMIDGVEEPVAGTYYELWLSDGPRHISAGSFSASGEIELSVAVARRDYPRVWITLEASDGVPGIGGPTVFDTAGFTPGS